MTRREEELIKGIKPQGKPWTRFLIGNPAASGRGIKNLINGEAEIEAFLTHLAVDKEVSLPKQN